MTIQDRRKKHEIFHESTSIQKKIINEKNFTYRIIFNVLNKYIRKNKKILDVGCGSGTLSLNLASKGNKVLGIDISGKAIAACRESARIIGLNNAEFKRMDFPNDIPKAKFDYIICCEVIEHLKNDELALEKIFSVLNKNGIAIISTPSENAPLYKLGMAN